MYWFTLTASAEIVLVGLPNLKIKQGHVFRDSTSGHEATGGCQKEEGMPRHSTSDARLQNVALFVANILSTNLRQPSKVSTNYN